MERVDFSLHVMYVGILEQADNLGYSVCFPYVRKELIPQSLAF